MQETNPPGLSCSGPALPEVSVRGLVGPRKAEIVPEVSQKCWPVWPV